MMIANYPFREAAIRSDAALKYINIAFTGVDHVDIPVCKQLGIHASNASGYSDIAVIGTGIFDDAGAFPQPSPV